MLRSDINSCAQYPALFIGGENNTCSVGRIITIISPKMHKQIKSLSQLKEKNTWVQNSNFEEGHLHILVFLHTLTLFLWQFSPKLLGN